MKTLALVLFGLSINLTIWGQSSIYTSVEERDCIDLKSNPSDEIDELEMKCPVPPQAGDYDVIISGADLRYGLDLKYKNQVIPGINIFERHFPNFTEMGSKVIEWRYNQKAKLSALIYRQNYQQPTANGNLIEISILSVVKLNGHSSCLIGEVHGRQSNANQVARRIADSIETENPPCQNE